MRTWWVVTLVLLWTGMLLAQATGEVESIGLDAYYRPDCWVPMTVKIRPTSGAALELQIRVIQEDLDRDRVVATRDITLTPDVSESAEPQRFWMYFRPQASGAGLADAAIAGTIKDLSSQLKVVLTTRDGATVSTLPITQQNLKRVEVGSSGRPEDVDPNRLVLCVTDGVSAPSGREYEQFDGIGAMPRFLSIRPRDLPEDVRGFEMVDAILWMGAAAPDPRRSLEEPRYRALEQYVEQGGMLVVCQGPEAEKLRGFEQILPVKVGEYRDSTELEPLPQMGGLDWTKPPEEASQARRVAISSALPGSLVVRSKTFDGANSPFLARRALGSGCVTWVAQDLGERTTVAALRGGWVRIWDEVFGWRNSPVPMKANAESGDVTAYSDEQGVIDVGQAFETGGGLQLKASGYVLMAVLFFAVYWVAAGPGMYAYLSVRRLAWMNWFMFGVVAVGAALLAILVVRIVQSRSPELEHVTMLRCAPGGYTTVQSRIGLYVPSEGEKELQITGTAPQTTNWITPYPEHAARQSSNARYLAMKQYTLPVVDATSDEPVTVAMPWRGTMKRLQVRWNGDLEAAITGKAALTGRFPDIVGTLVNGTPWDLREIYLAYRVPTAGDGTNAGGDRVIYIPKWDKGQSIELGQLLTSDKAFRIGPDRLGREAVPGYDAVVYGGIERLHRGFDTEIVPGDAWAGFWYSRDQLSPTAFGLVGVTDSSSGYQASWPLASLFDRIPPMRNSRPEGGPFRATRRTVARLGARFMNASPAVAAGNLVVLAQARGQLPIPFTVDGDAPKGAGVILCQYILPLGESSRPAVEKQ